MLVLLLPAIVVQVYIAGRYRPCSGSNDTYYSVTQMFVDDTHARGAGRAVWGYPKVNVAVGRTSCCNLQPFG
jgi:acetoacetate decarboxylase